MTRLELANRVQNYMQNPVYYSGVNFNDSIQDGLDEICAFSGCLFGSATLPYTANLSYYDLRTLIPNYIGVVAIFNAVIRRWMTPTSLRKLDQVRIDWECAGGTPYYFVPVSHRYVAIYKKPLTTNYGNMYVFYRASAPTLSDGTSIPLPADHLTVLESYVKKDLWEQQQEFTKGSIEYKNYVEEVLQLKTYMSKKDPDRQMSLRGK